MKNHNTFNIVIFQEKIREFIRENPDIKLFEIEKIFSDILGEFCENNQSNKRG